MEIRQYLYNQISRTKMEKIIDFRNRIYVKAGFINKENLYEYGNPDKYDKVSVHFVIYNNEDKIIGYARLIHQMNNSLPIFDEFPEIVKPDKPYVEISRLSLDNNYRGKILNGIPLIEHLYIEFIKYSLQNKVTLWLQYIDENILKHLNKTINIPVTKLAKGRKVMGSFSIPTMFDLTMAGQVDCKAHFKELGKYFSLKKNDYEEFTSRNYIYIKEELQRKISDAKILVAGAGLGSIFSELAVRTGFTNMTIADGDYVELSNLNRQAYTRKDIGKNKSKSIANHLNNINPEVNINVIDYFLTKETLESEIINCDYVINTIDFEHPAFIECNNIAQKHNKTVIFPMNIGWGSAIYVFNENSVSMQEMIKGENYNDIKFNFVFNAIKMAPCNYHYDLYKAYTDNNIWKYDPQLGAGAYLTASLIVTTLVSLLNDENVILAPNPIFVDLKNVILSENNNSNELNELLKRLN